MVQRRRFDPMVSELLGGAQRKHTRPRGFVAWSPQGPTKELLNQVEEVLVEYEDYLPLTIRQIYYRLIGAYDYDKTEQSYFRLCGHLTSARRARLIPMHVIRDDGGSVLRQRHWSGAEQFLAAIRAQAARLELDHSDGQTTRLVVMCEAVGMAPQLARVANPFGVTVMSGGGTDSVTDKYNFALELATHDRPTELLHIGDHDPSGVHIFLAFMEDVQAFSRDLGGDVKFTRLAVTPDQIRRFRLPTAPPKLSDKRAFRGQTCQAEALAPDDLAGILRDAIEARIDRSIYQRVLQREQKLRRDLIARLKDL